LTNRTGIYRGFVVGLTNRTVVYRGCVYRRVKRSCGCSLDGVMLHRLLVWI